jgi:hypothetical protein
MAEGDREEGKKESQGRKCELDTKGTKKHEG